MKITFYHHVPLPVKTYGGTERIMFWHMKELVRLGHEVVLLGHPDSTIREFGIKLIPLEDKILRNGWEELIPEDSDIIHLQFSSNLETKVPLICTVHGNGQIGEVFHHNSVFVSSSHAKNHASKSYVYNALDFSEYPCPQNISNKGKDHLLFLGKVSWRIKNVKDSKRVAKINKKHLHIAGGRSFSFSKYIHNHGFIGGEEKLKLLTQCDALVFPVRWHEPFGIAMIEAMSQGLPVFGSQYGSLPEVIGEAGKACKNFEEFNDAVKNFDCKLNSVQIREYCQSKFSIETYTQSYLDLYHRVISGEKLNEQAPLFNLEQRAENLLPF